MPSRPAVASSVWPLGAWFVGGLRVGGGGRDLPACGLAAVAAIAAAQVSWLFCLRSWPGLGMPASHAACSRAHAGAVLSRLARSSLVGRAPRAALAFCSGG